MTILALRKSNPVSPFTELFLRAAAFTSILTAGLVLSPAGYAQQPKWISAYYSGWWQGTRLNPDEIDYSAVTCIIHFALVVSPDGTFAGEGNGITPANAASTVRAAHAAGKRVLISVGGANSEASFSGAASTANRAAFISRLLEFTRKIRVRRDRRGLGACAGSAGVSRVCS